MDDFYVRVELTTADAGGDRQEAVAWIKEWLEKAIEDAPFHVDHAHVEAVMECEVLDV